MALNGNVLQKILDGCIYTKQGVSKCVLFAIKKGLLFKCDMGSLVSNKTG